MRPNRLRALLSAGKPTLGTHLLSTWPTLVELVGEAGSYDYVEFTAEYAPFDLHELDNLGRALELVNLAGMIKYGVPSPEAVWAMTAGVASRRGAIAVADAYLRDQSDRSASGFRRWLARMDPDSVAEQLGFSGGELEATARAILRSQPNEFLARLDTEGGLYPLTASVRPVRSAVDSGLIYDLEPGDLLVVQRDRDSRLNRNSVLLLVDRVRLGYLQADAARAVALDLDSGNHARAEVVSVEVSNGTTEVQVVIDLVARQG